MSRRAAAYSPKIPAIKVPTIPAPTTNTAEFTNRGPINDETFSPFANDVPKFPCNTPPIQLPYCAGKDRFKCN